ncbi:hypothetical protein [Paraburkholderia kururiensis]|uniref:hypothetical protein n=1 Tax=Paraburkholderia kururiensis TaxID=984307 RepID=UPI00130068B3|nr:hypothetical protein [Paraburkholderia kururiensis]
MSGSITARGANPSDSRDSEVPPRRGTRADHRIAFLHKNASFDPKKAASGRLFPHLRAIVPKNEGNRKHIVVFSTMMAAMHRHNVPRAPWQTDCQGAFRMPGLPQLVAVGACGSVVQF